MRSSKRVAVVLVVTALASGCATYTDKLSVASLSASRGDYESSLGAMTGLLKTPSLEAVPAKPSGDQPVLLLDRGSLQQATARFENSQRDFAVAEKHLELLDLSTNGIAALGSYLYSDDVKTYRSPPSEKLALNPFNMLNYLARNDLQEAAVEGRRFQAVRDYLESLHVTARGPDRLGAYLTGMVFEKMGEGDRALRYYDEALADGALSSLQSPICRLARSWPYRGKRIGGVVAKRTPASKESEILIVLSVGRVPHKVPQRIPVGAAVSLAGALAGNNNTSFYTRSAAKMIVYPELVATPSSLGHASVTVNGREVELDQLADIGASVVAEYQAAKPKIIAAALTRMAARAAAAEAARAAGNEGSKELGNALGVLTELALDALDTPDTRSWTMLADRVMVARVPVDPGSHDVQVRFQGMPGARAVKVDVPDKGFATVVVTAPS